MPRRGDQLDLWLEQLGSLLEHPLAVLGAETCRLRRVDEVEERVDELLRSLDLGEVTDTLDYHQSAPGHGLVRGVGVADRDDVVPVSPDDQSRHRGRQVEPIHGADRLTPGIDDGLDRADERLAVLRLGQ